MTPGLAIAVTGLAIASLLVAVLWLRVPAFLALLVVALGAGLAFGMETQAVLASIQKGMGGTLGYVAVVVGLGAMFGALLEHCGGIRLIADRILGRFGESRADFALGVVGFLVAIPVFFDVALILLLPVVFGLQRRIGGSVVLIAMPLLAGLAATHAFIPPTPGPIAVTELLGADLGWVILAGALCGFPAMIAGGPLLVRIYRRNGWTIGSGNGQTIREDSSETEPRVTFLAVIGAVLLPLVLILGATAASTWLDEGPVRGVLTFIGHPFTALIIACTYVYVSFGVLQRVPRDEIRRVMVKGLEPAGIVVLVTGAGGAFKQLLVDSGAGQQLAEAMTAIGIAPLFLAFALAAVVRVVQGSATVAMITAAGIMAPIVASANQSAFQVALLVIAIAAGGSVLSHVNDSGFWLVSRFLRISEAETLKTWTVTSTAVGTTGFLAAALLWQFS